MTVFSKTQTKGELACLKFDVRALEKGGVSSKPTIDVPYDRILDVNNNLYRVQIKYTNSKISSSSGSVQVGLRRTTRSGKVWLYQDSEIDILVVYVYEVDKLCWFEKDIFMNKQSLAIRYLPTKNNQKKGCLMIEDYVW